MKLKDVLDYLKQYIDEKILRTHDILKKLFDEYRVKYVADNIESAIEATKKFLGAFDSEPSERIDGSKLQIGDCYLNTIDGQLYFFNGTRFQTFIRQWVNTDECIFYTNKRATNTKIIIPSGTNAGSIDSIELPDGTEFIIQNDATFKIL